MADKNVVLRATDGSAVLVKYHDNGDGTFSPTNVSTPAASEVHVGEVGGVTPRVTATLTRPGDATAYAAGDLLANSQTAASVVPITFTAARVAGGSGRITGCRCVVTPASANLVIANLAFDLLLFRPATGIPFAAGSYPADNAALAVSAAAMRELVAIFSFVAAGWRSPAGSVSVAGVTGYQSVQIASGRAFAPFNLDSVDSADILGLCQMQAAWNPGNVAQQIDFALDVEGN